MRCFTHTVKNDLGLHARPAGLLVRLCSAYHSQISLAKGEKTIDSKRIFSVMSLSVKWNDTITLTADGPDEDAAVIALKNFFDAEL